MTERKLLASYNEARAAYDASPSIPRASELQKRAVALADLSDDYQEVVDEADDILADEEAPAGWRQVEA